MANLVLWAAHGPVARLRPTRCWIPSPPPTPTCTSPRRWDTLPPRRAAAAPRRFSGARRGARLHRVAARGRLGRTITLAPWPSRRSSSGWKSSMGPSTRLGSNATSPCTRQTLRQRRNACERSSGDMRSRRRPGGSSASLSLRRTACPTCLCLHLRPSTLCQPRQSRWPLIGWDDRRLCRLCGRGPRQRKTALTPRAGWMRTSRATRRIMALACMHLIGLRVCQCYLAAFTTARTTAHSQRGVAHCKWASAHTAHLQGGPARLAPM